MQSFPLFLKVIQMILIRIMIWTFIRGFLDNAHPTRMSSLAKNPAERKKRANRSSHEAD